MKNTKLVAGIKSKEIKGTLQRRRPAPRPQSARECPVQATPAQTCEFEGQSRIDDQADLKQI